MRHELDEALRRIWGYADYRPLQREAMEAILARRDSVVVLPTGGGKSICYQAPAVVAGPALVVSPLISLMKDQVDALVASGVRAAALHSAQEPTERAEAWRALRGGRLDLLYASPERVCGEGSEAVLEALRHAGVRFVAIDEAHCISHWGHDFRPEYRLLGRLREVLGATLHAFTATATPRVRHDIAVGLGLEQPEILVGDVDRPNLVYRGRRRDDAVAQIREVVDRHPGEGGIVYAITRKEVERLAAKLSSAGVRAVPYHAGLDDLTRGRHQDGFLAEEIEVVVATVAFGMGIDRSNVRWVVHAGAPKSLEHYQQESGRAGRDGLAAECLLLYSPADFLTWERLIGGEHPSSGEQLASMRRYAYRIGCRHRTLAEHFGQRWEKGSCGACDWCLGELEEIDDGHVVAQKILSCVIRVGQRWGAGHVVDVLRGRDTDRVLQHGHDGLSTFGLLPEVPAGELRGHVEQLVAFGLLGLEGDRYPTLAVTDDGWKVLRDQEDASLYRQPRPTRSARSRRRGRGRSEADWEGVDRELFERLRALRADVASERGVPPYVVFHDTTLRDLARRRPATRSQLLACHGIGDRKAADLGERILATIAAPAD